MTEDKYIEWVTDVLNSMDLPMVDGIRFAGMEFTRRELTHGPFTWQDFGAAKNSIIDDWVERTYFPVEIMGMADYIDACLVVYSGLSTNPLAQRKGQLS